MSPGHLQLESPRTTPNMTPTLFRPPRWNYAITLARSTRLNTFVRPSSSQSDDSTPEKQPNRTPKSKKSPKKLVPPKRAMNIMQLVTQNVMNEFKQKYGKLGKEDARGCFKIAAQQYRSLSEDEKKTYMAELDRRRVIYDNEMRVFLESLTPDDYVNQKEYIRRRKAQGRTTIRKGIPKLDPNAPKRPMNGFMIFCTELRSNPSKIPILAEQLQASEKDSNSSVLESSKILANYWRSMDEELKQRYVLEGQRRSDLYKQEKAAYDAERKSNSGRYS